MKRSKNAGRRAQRISASRCPGCGQYGLQHEVDRDRKVTILWCRRCDFTETRGKGTL